jgi:hypothetical protein
MRQEHDSKEKIMKNEEFTKETRNSHIIQWVLLILLVGLIMWLIFSDPQHAYCKSIGDVWNCGRPFK